MAITELGHAAAGAGWREKAADAVAPRIGRSRLPLGTDEARTALGLLFLALSVKYVVGTLRRTRR